VRERRGSRPVSEGTVIIRRPQPWILWLAGGRPCRECPHALGDALPSLWKFDTLWSAAPPRPVRVAMSRIFDSIQLKLTGFLDQTLQITHRGLPRGLLRFPRLEARDQLVDAWSGGSN
jgi:hypothetical protein